MTEMNPRALFVPQRMDLTIKYLYAKSVLSGCIDKNVESLYLRHVFMRTQGLEPLNEYGKTEKTNLNDYTEGMADLCLSMAKNGFDKNHPVPLSVEGGLLNGAHRTAVATALGVDINVEIFDKKASPWGWNWFEENGFSPEDKMRILKAFMEVLPHKTSIAVLFSPAFDYWKQIKVLLQAEGLELVGEVDLDFEDNFIAFKNMFLDIYEVWGINQNKKQTIVAKAELLSALKLSVKVIVFYDKENQVHQKTLALKAKARDYLDHKISKQIFATLHSADSERESRHLANVLLSPNNLKHLRLRMCDDYRPEFLRCCEKLKKECNERNINLDQLCIVGSGPLEVLGIKKAADLDCIMGQKSSVMLKAADIVKHYCRNDEAMNDDVLINQDERHFYFNGLKFVNLEIVKQRKQFQGRDKDIADVRKIELFENFWRYVDKDKLLKLNIDKEFERRRESKKSGKRWKYFLLYQLTLGKWRKKYKKKYKSLK